LTAPFGLVPGVTLVQVALPLLLGSVPHRDPRRVETILTRGCIRKLLKVSPNRSRAHGESISRGGNGLKPRRIEDRDVRTAHRDQPLVHETREAAAEGFRRR